MSEKKLAWPGSALLGPVSPVLVSCGEGQSANLITIAWAGTVCTQPPRVSISVRPTRHSYGLIRDSGEFVINLPTVALARAVDWCGVKSGRELDKFSAMGLHAAPASKVGCPLLAESPVNLECRVFQRIELGSHDLFLADVVAVDVDEALLDSAGKLHLEKAGLLAYAHGDYYALGKQLGKFGWSVRRKKPGGRKPGAQRGKDAPGANPRRPQK